MRILFVGDSITAGLGTFGTPFPVLVREALGHERAEVISEAESGATVAYHVERLPRYLAHQADVAVIYTGNLEAVPVARRDRSVNLIRLLPARYRAPGWLHPRPYLPRSWIRRNLYARPESFVRTRLNRLIMRLQGSTYVLSPREFERDLRRLVCAFQQAGTRVILCGIGPLSDIMCHGAEAGGERFRRVIRRVATDTGSGFFDVDRVFEDVRKHDQLLLLDRFHPSAAGHARISAALASHVEAASHGVLSPPAFPDVQSRRPKLLCLMQLPPPVHGASVLSQHIATSGLINSQFDLETLPFQFAESNEDIGRFSARKLFHSFGTGVRLAQKLSSERPDALYLTLSPFGPAFYRDCLYIAIAKAFNARRIYHLHGKGIEKHARGWRRHLYTWAFKDAFVLHLSPLLARETKSLVDPGGVFFVANGVEQRPTNLEKRTWHDPPRILFLSNMVEDKGPLILVEALGRLAARGSRFEATFAGAASRHSCVPQFERRVAALGLADRIRYVGPAYGEAKDRLFREHDIFAFPTFYARETWGLVLLEAMQWSLPVVTTNEGAITEFVTDGGNGFIVRQRDPVHLAERLEALLRDEVLARTMGERGREAYLRAYTLDAFENRFAQAVARCLDAEGSRKQ